MKITSGKFEIAENKLANTLTIIGDGGEVVELIGKMDLTMIRHELEGAGIIEPQLTADTNFCKTILNKEAGFTAQNNTTTIA